MGIHSHKADLSGRLFVANNIHPDRLNKKEYTEGQEEGAHRIARVVRESGL